MSHGEINRFSVFEPSEARILTKAYEDAWRQVAATFAGREPTEITALKARMAAVILALAEDGERDHDVLVAGAQAAVRSEGG